MRFYSLTNDICDSGCLEPDYKSARQIGKLRIGENGLFVKSGFRVYHIPYERIKRCFRRVMLVPAKLCCGKGELAVENLIICDEARELASVSLPGTRAATALMEELQQRIPDAEFRCAAAETEKETAQ